MIFQSYQHEQPFSLIVSSINQTYRPETYKISHQVTPPPPSGLLVGLEASHCAQPHQCGLQIPAEHDLPWVRKATGCFRQKNSGKCQVPCTFFGMLKIVRSLWLFHSLQNLKALELNDKTEKTILTYIDIITPAPAQMPDPTHATQIHTMRLCRASTWHSSKNCCSSRTCWACCTCKASTEPAVQYISSVMLEKVTCSKHLEFSEIIYISIYLPMFFVFLVSHVVPRFLGLLICQSLCSLHKASSTSILKRSGFASSLPRQHIKQPGYFLVAHVILESTTHCNSLPLYKV